MQAGYQIGGGHQLGLRAYNRRMILNLIRQSGALPKAEIARLTGLSAQAASVIVNALLKEKLVRKEKRVRGKVGQPHTPIALNAKRRPVDRRQDRTAEHGADAGRLSRRGGRVQAVCLRRTPATGGGSPVAQGAPPPLEQYGKLFAPTCHRRRCCDAGADLGLDRCPGS